MTKKKIRYPLEMSDGTQVRSLDELQEHFDLKAVLGYYKSGQLSIWLNDRYLEDEAEAVSALDENAPDFQKQLCAVFGVEFQGEEMDLEEIKLRQERLKRLRQFTDEEVYIDHIDQVAFDQEELADLLDNGVETIYLCGEKFTVPASQKGKTYIGINQPEVKIGGKYILDDLEIHFDGCVLEQCIHDSSNNRSTITDKQKEISTISQRNETMLDLLFSKYESNGYIRDCIETDNFYLTCAYYERWSPENDNIDYINKNTGEIKTISDLCRPFYGHNIVNVECISDLIAYSTSVGIILHNLSDNSTRIISENYHYPKILCTKDHYIVYKPTNSGCYNPVTIYDVLTGQINYLKLPPHATCYYSGADISNNLLYLISGNSFNQTGDSQKRNFIISVVDLKNNCAVTTQQIIKIKDDLPSRYDGGTEIYCADNLKVIGKYLYCFIENVFDVFDLGSKWKNYLIQIDLTTWSIKYLLPDEERQRKRHGIISMSIYDDWIIYGTFDGEKYNHGSCSIEGIRIADGERICLVPECTDKFCPNNKDLFGVFVRIKDRIYFLNPLNGNYSKVNLN